MKLSICIATHNRAAFIGATIDAILPQLTPQVELVVVDGASTDTTFELVNEYRSRHPGVVYRRESVNGGVDRDFDKAVSTARGKYCWLMSDDDLIERDAVAVVLAELEAEPQLLVLNAQVRTRDLSQVLKANQIGIGDDASFGPSEQQRLLAMAGRYLSFIGGVVIRRECWFAREREAYFGTLFVHVGVIFQPPGLHTRVLARPLVHIRYGNAMWTARGFGIWVRNWPSLIWSFAHLGAAARASVTPRHPATSARTLLWYRALGVFNQAELQRLNADGEPSHAAAVLLSRVPARWANALVAVLLWLRSSPDDRVMVYDLVRAPCSSATARGVARLWGLSS